MYNLETERDKDKTRKKGANQFKYEDDESVNSDIDNSNSYNKTSMLFSKYKTILHNITNRGNNS